MRKCCLAWNEEKKIHVTYGFSENVQWFYGSRVRLQKYFTEASQPFEFNHHVLSVSKKLPRCAECLLRNTSQQVPTGIMS